MVVFRSMKNQKHSATNNVSLRAIGLLIAVALSATTTQTIIVTTTALPTVVSATSFEATKEEGTINIGDIKKGSSDILLGQDNDDEGNNGGGVERKGILRGGRFGNGVRNGGIGSSNNAMTNALSVSPPPQSSESSGINNSMKEDEEEENKRTNNLMNNLSTLSYDISNTMMGKTNDQTIHVMIDCLAKEDELSCKNRILKQVRNQGGVIRMTQYLKLCHGYAAEVKDKAVLMTIDGVHEDRPRETLHIRDSIVVHDSVSDGAAHGRNLQSSSNNGQYTPYGIDLVKAKEAWKKHDTKGENVRVCVMDTGVYRDHPDLDQLFGYDGNDLVQPWWRDSDGHGTHITGTIVANDNSQGVVGVAPGAEIFTARVFSTNGMFYSSNIITALQVCKDGNAQIISMSLGGPDSVGYEQKAYKDLYEKFNIVTVAASGNTGGYDFLYPASYDHVISVASVNWNGDRSRFSTRNSKVDVAAPGESILSTWENGSYATVSGTSMACPHVSGIAALMLSKNPTATPAQITKAFQQSSSRSSPNSDVGYGIVDAVAAVDAILEYKDDDDSSNDDDDDSSNNSENDDDDDDDDDDDSVNDDDDDDCLNVVITLRTDRYASDNKHWMQSDGRYLFYEDDFDSFSTYREETCVNPNVCTTYNIRDSFGDGITGEALEIKISNMVEYEGGDFGVGGIKTIGNC